MTSRSFAQHRASPGSQKGVTTLAITLILLVIITMMVIFSTNVGFFEQKTATNENRARISQQAAEYAINLAGEYLKANRDKLIANTTAEGGWLAPSATARWVKCADVGAVNSDFPAGHACLSERVLTRRAQLYFYTRTGAVGGDQTLNYTAVIPVAAQVENGMGGTSAFTAAANVRALLCRLDTSDPANVACKLNPVAGNRVALTLISDASLSNENGAKGAVKETWASYSNFVPSATVPLVASGFVTGLGNGEIVASPDSQANGSNVLASIWSPNNVDSGGSYITCQFSEFTNQLSGGTEMTMRDVKTTCPGLSAGSSPPCHCPKSPDPDRTSKEDWSGHGTGGGGTFHKGDDILDVVAGEPVCDSTVNTIIPQCRTLPSITFFPGVNGSGTAMDHTDVNVIDDDSAFEYIFGVNYETAPTPTTPVRARTTGLTLSDCGTTGTQNCLDYAMREEFEAIIKTCADLDSASAKTLSGIIYVVGPCGSLSNQIGDVDTPAIVVINQGNSRIDLKNGMRMYGMLFIHSDNQKANVQGTDPEIYGSLVVEGNIKMTGQFLIVYDDTSSSSSTTKIPKNAKFGLVPGSWLDAKTSF